MTNNLASIMARDAIRPQSPVENRGLPKASEPTFLRPGDRITARVCGDLITGTVQLPDPEVFFGAKRRGAEFAYYRDRIWRVEFLADDGRIICCHRDQCHAAGGAA